MNNLKKIPLFKQRGFHLFLLTLPFIVLVFLLSYLPLRGWAFAFFDYRPGRPLTSQHFVGFHYFTSMISDQFIREDIIRVMRNTFVMSGLGILGSPLPMILAMLLNEIRFTPFKRVTQTLITIPNFISWVLVYAVAFAMFSVGDGFVNRMIQYMGGTPINFLASSSNVWFTMWGYEIWKGVGWGTIIYFAALSGIDQEQYEAARIDGAGRFSCMLHITLPGLLPTYFVLLILSIGHLISNNLEQFMMFQNPMNRPQIEVLDLFVYNQGIGRLNYAYATAVGVLKSLVSITLLFIANSLSKIFREETLF